MGLGRPGRSIELYVQCTKAGIDSLDVIFCELVGDKGEVQGEAKSTTPKSHAP